MLYLIALGYAASCVAAYFLFKRTIIRKFDYTVADRRFAVFISALGPTALVAVIIITLIDMDRPSGRVILERRRG